MKPCVYVITHCASGKRYVGKANHAVTRWRAHHTDARRTCPETCIGRALKKYGQSEFEFKVLEWCITEDAAYERERYWVSYFKSDQPEFGYNIESGGRGGKTLSAESRAKVSAALKGKPLTPTHRERIGAAQRGKPRSPAQVEHVTSLIEAHRGVPFSAERRAAMSQARRGQPKSEEHRAKIAAAMKGKMLGRKLSDEHREKIGAYQRGRPKPPGHGAKVAAAKRARTEKEDSQ
jgi:group I intron endonuclease